MVDRLSVVELVMGFIVPVRVNPNGGRYGVGG